MHGQGINITFAGQAGFIFENEQGYRVGVDLYLSDCCDRYFGFKRLMPCLYNPLEMNLDILVATHAHYDHFDPDSVPLMLSGDRTQLLAACDVKEEAERLNLDAARITYLKAGDTFENDQLSIRAMPCDHGSETPHAIGLLITMDEKRIYIAGDTCYREDHFALPEVRNVDVLILPINGAFGNLNEKEAAKAAGVIRPRLTIPCHYWNFAEHGGNPNVFAEEMKTCYKDLNYRLMRMGERIRL